MAALGFTWQVCMCESLCVFKFCSAESLANPLCTSQCPVSEELWPLSSCSLLNPLKKMRGLLECKWAGMHQNLSWGTHSWVRDTKRKVQHCSCGWLVHTTCTHNCAGTCRLRVDRLCSAGILLRIKWSCCNYISLGIRKRRLQSLIHQIKWTPGTDLLCKYLCSLKQVGCVSYFNCLI